MLIRDSVKTITADKDGYLNYSWERKGHKIEVHAAEKYLFKKGQTGMSKSYDVGSGDGNDLIFTTYCRNEDGTVTIALYHTSEEWE